MNFKPEEFFLNIRAHMQRNVATSKKTTRNDYK